MKKIIAFVLFLTLSIIAPSQETRLKQSSFRYLSNGAIKVTRDKSSGSIHVKAIKGTVTTFGYRYTPSGNNPKGTIEEIPAYYRNMVPGDQPLAYYPDGESWIVINYTNPKTKKSASLILHPIK